MFYYVQQQLSNCKIDSIFPVRGSLTLLTNNLLLLYIVHAPSHCIPSTSDTKTAEYNYTDLVAKINYIKSFPCWANNP